MMKKFIYLFLSFGLLMLGCTDDLQKDIDDLKDKVANLEATDLASMEFQGSNLVVTYGDGSTSTVTVPSDVIPNRVVDFEIDNATGVITVTFSDGTTKQYTVLSNGSTTYLSGTLTGDYGIASMTVGDVTLANLSYDDQNRMVQALINLPDGYGNVINIMDLQNNYADETPMAIAIEKSMHADFDYSTVESYSYTWEYLDTYEGSYYVEEDAEETGMYTYYSYYGMSGSQYMYYAYPKSWFEPEDEVEYGYPYYHRVADEDSLFYKSYSYQWITVDTEYGRVYYNSQKIRITDVYEAGEIMDTARTKLTLRDDDLIEKVELLDWNGEVGGYIELTYDGDDLVTLADIYDLYDPTKGDGIDPDTAHYAQVQFIYTDNLLTKLNFAYLNPEDETVEELIELVEIVYDEVGNPTEIWAIPGYSDDEEYIVSVDGSGRVSIDIREDEMIKFVEIEYDYTLPNFFGESLESLIPELKGLKIKNAPVRLVHSGFFNFVNMEYSDYNQGGYPAKVKMEAYIGSMLYRKSSGPDLGFITTPIGTEMLLEYTLFE